MLPITSDSNLSEHLQHPVFSLIGETADRLGLETYVVGGYVRDLILRRPSTDIDVVTVGSGITLAKAVAEKLGPRTRVQFYGRFGTAQLIYKGVEVEFVGARKESYRPDSRKPLVEDGSLEDDQKRRDFTINAMAICLNRERFGALVDPFYGLEDMADCLIRTPLDPDVTFSDDPLRMMRAIRFASQLGFFLDAETFEAIERNAQRIEIVSAERIIVELNKIMASPRPSIGLELFEKTGLMKLILPELLALRGAETKDGVGHKDNLAHTYRVVDNLAQTSDNLFLRWAALLHDIAKPQTKRFDRKIGWTFHNHNIVGAKMIPRLFRRLKLPMDRQMRYVAKMVDLHMRPAALADEGVTDSAIRRLLFDAGEDIDDLMLLVEADITSKNPERVRRHLNNYRLIRKKLVEIEEKDRIRNFNPPISGQEIMELFGLPPSPPVGQLKECIKNAILDGLIPNEYDPALELLLQRAVNMGLTPVANVTHKMIKSPVEEPIELRNEEEMKNE